jgi:asparagine synthetase B (glutamine-hydrolysing)
LPGFRTSPRVAKAAAIAGLPPRAAYAELSALALASTLDDVLAPEARLLRDPLLARFESEPDPHDVAADCGRLDLLSYLPEDLLVKADRASMLSGVEIWSPFLDPACVEFALRLPGAARTDARKGKLPLRALLVRRGFSDLLARKKRGFGVPLRAWLLDGPLAAHAAEVLDGVREPFRGVLKDGSAAPLLERLRRGEPLEHVVYACVVAATHADAFR